SDVCSSDLFMDDLRLAGKLVSVVLDVAPYLNNAELRRAQKLKLDLAILDFVDSGKNLTPERLFSLLQVDPNAQSENFKKAWEEGKFEIRFLSDGEISDLQRNTSFHIEFAAFLKHAPEKKNQIILPNIPHCPSA